MRSDQRPHGRFSGKRPFQQQPRPSQRNQSFDSNGPNLKIRGNAHQIFERYVALAREAAIGGDPVAAENFYQHAEHYFRVAKENRDGNQQAARPMPSTPADIEMTSSGSASSGHGDGDGDRPQSRWGSDEPASNDPSTA